MNKLKEYRVIFERTVTAESTVMAKSVAEAKQMIANGEDTDFITIDGTERDKIIKITEVK